MNILNEVSFLKNIEKTPSFILLEKDGSYREIEMSFNQKLGSEEDVINGWEGPAPEMTDESTYLSEIMKFRAKAAMVKKWPII